MAVTTAPPTLTVLPPPPLPTDAEAVFDAKAGASLTAQGGMVVEINTALAWQAASMTATQDYKTAAGQSAMDAQASARAAAQSALDATANGNAQVGLAKDQVELAKGQVAQAQAARTGAETAKAGAEAAAVAAGAAAGLPEPNGAGNVLMINPANDGVAFASILPVLHATALLF